MNRLIALKPGRAALLIVILTELSRGAFGAGPKLHLEEVVADEASIYTVAVEVVGPSEILLWDGQFHVEDAKRLADQIASSGKHLKAIVISHPDGDHYYGAATILERFPGTPVYMTAAALEVFNRNAEKSFRNGKERTPDLLPESLVTPQVLPSMHLTVDGETVEVFPDLQGDMSTKLDSFLWIPSLRAILAGDLLFSGVHPYLASSSEKARVDWRESCRQMSEFHPLVVVAGHKKATDDSPDVLNFMDRYLADFEAARLESPDAESLVTAMTKKYPDLALPRFLQSAAKAAYATK